MSVLATDGLIALSEGPADGLVTLFIEGLIGVEGLVIVALIEFLIVDGVADAVILVVFLDPG